MKCKHCNKEEETITIAGKTYCANCSTLLAEREFHDSENPKHKIPKMEITENEIRTEAPPANKNIETPELKELSLDAKIPKVNKDDLEGSAILLDILSEKAKDSADESTVETNKNLEKASDEVIDLLAGGEKVKRNGTGSMNDITPANIKKRQDFIHKKNKSLAERAKEEIKEETENLGKIISSEKGYTKEYDLLIMSAALTTLVFVIIGIFLTFK